MAAWAREEEKASEKRQRERRGRGEQGLGCTWGDRSRLGTF